MCKVLILPYEYKFYWYFNLLGYIFSSASSLYIYLKYSAWVVRRILRNQPVHRVKWKNNSVRFLYCHTSINSMCVSNSILIYYNNSVRFLYCHTSINSMCMSISILIILIYYSGVGYIFSSVSRLYINLECEVFLS